MAEIEGGDVTRHAFQVAYHGTHPDDHSMDVESLAPALLAFGRLIREANTQINGSRAKVKVLVTSDFEHKCFNINFELIQTVMQAIKSFLQDDNVETATKLLQTIGVVGGAGGVLSGGLLAFLKIKRGRKITNVQKVSDTDSSGDVILNLKIEGEHNNVQITNNVFKLSENPKILQTIEETLKPIETKDADRIEFRQADKPTASYDRDDIRAIISSCESGPDNLLPTTVDAKPDIVTATLYSYGPVLDDKAKTWRFRYKRKPIYADISETSIAKETMRRGGVLVNDRYRVKMEVIPPESEERAPHYKIIEVLDFTQGAKQEVLPLRKPRRKSARKRK